MLLLHNYIKSDFKNYLLGLGFQLQKKSNDDYMFCRSTMAHVELVEVQFDMHGKPKFVLNFGVVPHDGLVDAYGRHLQSFDVQIGHLPKHGRLYSLPYTIFWFGPRFAFRLRSPEKTARNSVHQMIKLFPQVECWLSSQVVGPNLKIYTSPWNEPGVRVHKQEMVSNKID